ncbi:MULTISPECIES: Beta-galactosidase C-terminal domain [unclassified Streptomyces]|uniref:Beta-galactosidase C-terminal domain n=1 Tax=unclassified Streptomyces TaxID=2593676 RepID=UPI003D750119
METATRVTPDGDRLLFLLDHTTRPAALTAHAAAGDLLTGKRVDQGDPLDLDPLGVSVLRLQWIRRPRASGTPDLRRK